MIKTRYEVETWVDALYKEITEVYDLPNNWIGDCYPLEIQKYTNYMDNASLRNDEYDFKLWMSEIHKLFDSWGKDAAHEYKKIQ